MITIIFEDSIDFYFARQRVTEKLGPGQHLSPAGRRALPGPRCDGTGPDLLVHGRAEPDQSHRLRPAVGTQQVLHRAAAQRGRRRRRRGDRRRHAAGISGRRATRGRCEPTASRWANCTRPSARATCRPAAASCRRTTPSTSSAASAGSRTRGTSKTRSSRKSTARRSTSRRSPTVQLGTQFRRSVYEKDGNEVVGGVVLMRHGENPLAVTERVKEKIHELQPGLPDGVHIVPAYDRTRLIHGAIHTLHRSDVARNGDRVARDSADPDARSQRVRHLRHAAACPCCSRSC